MRIAVLVFFFVIISGCTGNDWCFCEDVDSDFDEPECLWLDEFAIDNYPDCFEVSRMEMCCYGHSQGTRCTFVGDSSTGICYIDEIFCNEYEEMVRISENRGWECER